MRIATIPTIPSFGARSQAGAGGGGFGGGGSGGGGGYDSIILAESSLTNFWPLNEAAGAATAIDNKGSDNGVNTAITAGSTALLTDGETSYSFNGSTSQSLLTTLTHPSNFSLEAWAFPTSNHGGGIFINGTVAGGGNGTGFYMFTSGANVDINMYSDAGGDFIGAAAQSINALYYLVLTFDGTDVKFYVNTILGKTYTHTPNAWIGSVIGNAVFYGSFAGNIAKVAYYNTALNATQIAAHYAAR